MFRSPRNPFLAGSGLAVVLLVSCGGGGGLGGSSRETPNGSAQTYSVGGTVTESLSSNTATGPNGGVGKLYTLTLTQQTNLQFSLTANGFPPFLGLYTATGQAIAERNSNDTTIKAFLPPGNYQLFVDSMNNTSGTYTLASTPAQVGPCRGGAGGPQTYMDNIVTVRGASLAGTITGNECGNSLAKLHNFELPLRAGDTVTATFTTDKAAGFVFRMPPNGAELAHKEFSGPGSGSFTITATTTGYHSVYVESRTINGVSSLPVAYTLSIQ